MNLCESSKIIQEDTKTSLQKLTEVALRASEENLIRWIENFGYESKKKSLTESILRNYYCDGTLQEGLLMLYHDLFSWDANSFVASLKDVADVLVIDRSSEKHYVVYSVEKVLNLTVIGDKHV